MKYLYFILLFLLGSITLLAQKRNICKNITWTSHPTTVGTTVSGISSTIPINIPTDIHQKVNYKLGSNTLVKIRFAIEDVNGVLPYGKGDPFYLEYEVTGELVDLKTSTVYNINQIVEISENQPESVISIKAGINNLPLNPIPSADPYTLGSSSTLYELRNLEIKLLNQIGTLPTNINSNTKLSVCTTFDFRTDVANSGVTVKMNNKSNALASYSSAYRNFQWNLIEDCYISSFELQVLKIENSEINPTNDLTVNGIIDWSKALKFLVPINTVNLEKRGLTGGGTGICYAFDLRPTEESGYYIWRVRPIGNYYEGAVSNNQNWGDWSSSLMTGDVFESSSAGLVSISRGGVPLSGLTTSNYFWHQDIDENQNYTYSRTYTERGEVFENISYADNLLRTRQTQIYLPAENKTVVGQNFYDQFGRTSITTLPVPVNGQMNGYKENFVQNPAGQNYTMKDYADENATNTGTIFNPNKINEGSNSAYQYYSDFNTANLTVPSAEGYPYSKTVYSRDGLNRVVEQSGVGSTHRIGTDKTTKTDIQIGVSEVELLSIFGDEAPNQQRVTKQIVTDPNGTTSLTYTSQSGKTLATCLVRPNQDNYNLETVAVNGKTNILPIVDALYLGEYNNGLKSFVSNKRFVLSENLQTLSLLYDPPGCTGAILPSCINALCEYEVKIEIFKLRVDTRGASSNTTVYTEVNSNVLGCNVISFPNATDLSSGTYIIKKTVTPKGQAVQDAIDAYLIEREDQISAYYTLMSLLIDQVSTDTDWDQIEDAVFLINNYIQGASLNLKQAIENLNSNNNIFVGKLDNFDFTQLTLFGTITPDAHIASISYTNIISPVDNTEVGQLKLEVKKCDGTTDEITAEVDNQKPKFNIGRTDYNYEFRLPIPNGQQNPNSLGLSYNKEVIDYDFPGFVEHFIDEVGETILDDYIIALSQNPSTSDPFESFFPDYRYFDLSTSNTWEPINKDFVEEYLIARNGYTHGGNLTKAQYEATLKRLNANQFNRMIWHMLQDKYYTESIRYDATQTAYTYFDEAANSGNGAWVPITLDPVTNRPTIEEYQYEVDNLVRCWTTGFGAIKKMLDLKAQGKLDLASNFDWDQTVDDETGAGGFMSKVNEKMPWIIRLFFGDQINDQMTNQAGGSPSGIQPNFNAIEIQPLNLPKRFLSCTGTRYARMVDPRHFNDVAQCTNFTTSQPYANQPHTTAATIDFNTYDMPLKGSASLFDPSGNTYYGIPTYGNERSEYYSTTERLSSTVIANVSEHVINYLPFVYNPVFAFKYYEYWDRSHLVNNNIISGYNHPWDGLTDNNNNTVSINYGVLPTTVSNELRRPYGCLLCEEQFGYDINIPNACNLNTFGHDQWGWATRYAYKQCILASISSSTGSIDFAASADLDNLSVSAGTLTLLDCDNVDVIAIQNSLEMTCNTACEERAEDIRAAVLQMFANACYTVGGCNSGDPTMNDVDNIVANIILECKSNCTATVTTSSTTCDIVGLTTTYCNVKEGEACELYKMEQAEYWEVELQIPARAGSPCANTSQNTWTSLPRSCEPGGVATPNKAEVVSDPKAITN